VKARLPESVIVDMVRTHPGVCGQNRIRTDPMLINVD
jgi:hypothetical protein